MAKADKSPRNPPPDNPSEAPDLALRHALGPALGLLAPIAVLVVFALFHWPGPWLTGPQLRHPWTASDTAHVGVTLGGAALAVTAFWIVLPIAHWLRRAPLDRYRNGNKAAWFGPLLLALPAWLGLYLAFAGCLALGAFAVFTGIQQLHVPELIRALRGP